jgi:glycosyltransferase involved in cell wall biosynthesis
VGTITVHAVLRPREGGNGPIQVSQFQRAPDATSDDFAYELAAKPSMTAVVLTFNEEVHIERCLRRLAPLAERVIVVDSFSTDRTVEVARALGAEILQRRFRNQADQFQWALDTLQITTDWILRLDADEYLEDRTISELIARLPSLPVEITGIDFRLRVIFRGRWLRFGGYYSTILTRMWRTGVGSYEQRWMDEKIVLSHGRSARIGQGDLVDESLKDIDWWTEKHNHYATRQMVDFINREFGLFALDDRVDRTAHRQARWKRFLRTRIYANAPLYARCILYFFQRYVLQLGFLDGWKAFPFHILHGLWYFLLIDAKIDEARSFIKANGVEAFKVHLATRYGIETR